MARRTTDFLYEALAAQTDACIVWPFGLHRGYARFELNRKRVRGNRYICEVAHGPPPTPEHEAAHLCGRKACLNPRHIRWSTRLENIHDRAIHEILPMSFRAT